VLSTGPAANVGGVDVRQDEAMTSRSVGWSGNWMRRVPRAREIRPGRRRYVSGLREVRQGQSTLGESIRLRS
jgi:hypothetical protein